MDKLFTLLCFLFILIFQTNLYGQNPGFKRPDSIFNPIKIDTSLKINPSKILNQSFKPYQSNQFSQYKPSALSKTVDGFYHKLLNLGDKKNALSFQGTIEDAVRVQPSSSSIQIFNPSPATINLFYVNGTLSVLGIPVNLNFNNDHSYLNNSAATNHSLYKFNFNASQFKAGFQSDIQQYYDLQMNSFKGLDILDYTRQSISENIHLEDVTNSSYPINSPISSYLDNRDHLIELLKMNQEQVHQKLTQISKTTQAKGLSAVEGEIDQKKKVADQLKQLKMDVKRKSDPLDQISANKELNGIFGNRDSVRYLQSLNEEEITNKLIEKIPKPEATKHQNASTGVKADINHKPVDSTYTKNVENYNVELGIVKNIAHQLFLNRKTDKTPQYKKLLASTVEAKDVNLKNIDIAHLEQIKNGVSEQDLKNIRTLNQVDSVSNVIAQIKENVKKNGVDLDKILKIQEYLNKGGNFSNPTEYSSSLLSRKPSNLIQQFFNRVQALKVGSFGNEVPGSTQNQELLMNGAHLSIKAGGMPVTRRLRNN